MIKIGEEKAVTLTAVIVSIIIILILASVTIYFAIGEDGIISKSKQGIFAYKEQSIREKIELKLSSWNMQLIENNEEPTIESIINLAKEDTEIQEARQSVNNVILIVDGYQCEVNKNLEVVGNITVYNPNTTIKRTTRMLRSCTIER